MLMAVDKVGALIQTHAQRYPEIDILDIYKLLHQAVFGPGHALTTSKNKNAAREWLDRESGLLQPGLNEPFVENIHPDGALVRVHLGPYMASHGKLDKLMDA